MGLQTVPGYIGESGYQHPVELDRNMVKGIFGRTGALRYGDFALTPLVGSLGLAIGAGSAVLVGTESAQQGAYFAWSDAPENKAFPAPAGSPRMDTLLLRVKDSQYGTISGSPAAYWDVASGTPSGSPAIRPDSDFNSGGSLYVPGAWWRVADIRVDPTDTVINPAYLAAGLRNRFVRTPGGTLLCTSSTRPTSPVWGDQIMELDTGLAWRYGIANEWELASPYVRKVTLSGSAASVTFSGIPSSLANVTVRWTTRSTDPGYTSQVMYLRINGVTANSSYRWMYAQASTTGANMITSASGTAADSNKANLGYTATGGSPAGIYSNGEVRFTGWNSPHSNYLGFNFETYHPHAETSGSNSKWIVQGSGSATFAGPYTSITFYPDLGSWAAGTQFVLTGEA